MLCIRSVHVLLPFDHFAGGVSFAGTTPTWLWNSEKEKRKLLQSLTFYQQKIKQTLLISVA
ncbi:hypothetical protein P615_19165 [Brevibacillus laterosporus PE36]|nr:hypothetical protein P615_19165 [Brevibacillus laterosporus PE36]